MTILHDNFTSYFLYDVMKKYAVLKKKRIFLKIPNLLASVRF
jgi:hypothetical protein